MGRGDKILNSISQDLFGEQYKLKAHKKGRSDEMIELRNDKIIARTYYYRRWHIYLKNDIVYTFLSYEFCLKKITMVELLEALLPQLKAFENKNMSINELNEMYPEFYFSSDVINITDAKYRRILSKQGTDKEDTHAAE